MYVIMYSIIGNNDGNNGVKIGNNNVKISNKKLAIMIYLSRKPRSTGTNTVLFQVIYCKSPLCSGIQNNQREHG